MGVTLKWLKKHKRLPVPATACFIVDYFASALTGELVVTDATSAASSGVFDVTKGAWDLLLIEALGLPADIFPAIDRAGRPYGNLTA
jgi:rhamnulokinase